jgi:hypothetical protein
MFSLYFGGPAIIISNGFFRVIADRFFGRGIKFLTKNFDKNDKIFSIYNQTFVNDACPYYEQEHLRSTDGYEYMSCNDIFDGVIKKVNFPKFQK